MTVLLLLAVLVLVLLNGFFVAAEFALVRVRRSRIEEDAEAGKRGAALGAAPARRPVALSRRLPARHHVHLAGHRLPRRAGRRRRSSRTCSATACRTTSRSAISLVARVPDHDVAAHHDRRAGPEDLRDQPRRARGALDRAGRCTTSRRSSARSSTSSTARRTAILRAARHPQDQRVRRGRLAGGAEGADRAVADRRQARPRRGEHAHRRLPPARAAGAPGHDAGARRS